MPSFASGPGRKTQPVAALHVCSDWVCLQVHSTSTSELLHPGYFTACVPGGLQQLMLSSVDAGLTPESLERAITQGGSKRPRVLYTIPHGQNPTGATMSMARKQAVYDLCSRHDVAIIEDDAYAYLQYPSAGNACPGAALPERSAPAVRRMCRRNSVHNRPLRFADQEVHAVDVSRGNKYCAPSRSHCVLRHEKQ